MGFFPTDVSQKVDYNQQAISVVYSCIFFVQFQTEIRQILLEYEICTVIITGLFLLSQPEMNKAKRVCVIGAGPSGMSALYQFKQLEMKGQEIPEIVCFEKQSDWGGLWKYSWRTGKVAIAFCRDLRWLKLSFAQGACRDFSFI